MTGCQVVVGTGATSPWFEKSETEEERKLMYNAFHYWKNVAGNWEERKNVGWYRVTPIKSNGERTQFVKENLGELYKAY